MKVNSISSRLLLASALFLPLFLGLTGFFLLKAFENSLYEAESARLRGHIYLLFSVAELQEENGTTADLPSLQMPTTLIEPDFERINSGLYAYIYDGKGQLIWRSNSAALLDPPSFRQFSRSTQPGRLLTQNLHLDEREFFGAHYDVVWEDSQGQGHPYRFAVAHTRTIFKAELKAYRTQLWRWLGTAALLLLLAQTAILHWGLQPLAKLASALKAMQSGETGNIAGEHPRELRQLVNNLNQVLAREKALRQRYRNSLSDLAHSLKTPLAVLQSKLQPTGDKADLLETVAEQVNRMNQVVTYQLQRAVSDQQQGMYGLSDVNHALQRILSALQKVYREKEVTCDLRVVTGTVFAGDEQDLLEMLGNLVENAFKYCRKHVQVDARCVQQQLVITLGDDGPGVPPEARSRILQRGQRLDTTLAGQGIGLAVVVDIINSYGGNLTIGTSPLQGAEFRVQLPLINPLAAKN